VLAAGQATPEQDDPLQKVLEGVQMMLDRFERFEVGARKKSYRISEAGKTVYEEIKSSGGVEGIQSVPVLFDASKHNARDVPDFKCGDGVESGQAAGYVKYVEEYLVQFNEKWSVLNGNKHPKLLNGILKGNGEGTEFRGTTDVVVVEKAAEGLPESGLKILFELKKDGTTANSTKAEYQTILSLLLANTICRHLRPVAVLTDLGNMWKFFYCDHSTVYRHTFPSRREAVGYLDTAILKGDIEPEDDSHDTSALRSPGESSSRGVKRSFSGRRKFSIPALEQLEELAGFLPEDELRQGRAAIALQCALYIPTFYSVVSDLRESPEGIYI